MKLKVGDFAKTVGGKALPKDTFVEILMEFQKGIFLCGSKRGNHIVVAKNLEPLEE